MIVGTGRAASRIDPATFEALSLAARRRLLRMHFESGVGHIGGDLSALDVMLHLHHRVMGEDDTFVLSKGHAAGALYVTLWSRGLLSDEDLRSFHADGSRLAGHPVPGWSDAIPVATGSLGHGLPMAAGIALADRYASQPGRVWCLTSDGEWQEGSNWEALIFARHQRLANLTVLVDANGLQAFGRTRDVASMTNLRRRFESFGVPTIEADGHDAAALAAAIDGHEDGLRVVVLRTVKGKGVSFMEDRLEWHYRPLTDDLFQRALRELED